MKKTIKGQIQYRFNKIKKERQKERKIKVPLFWSDTAAKILGENYAQKISENRYESSLDQIIKRLVDCWIFWGKKSGHLKSLEIKKFRDYVSSQLFYQMAAPNSPQWFNSGIKSSDLGHYYFDEKKKKVLLSRPAFKRPRPHACFIQAVSDDLLGETGIMKLWEKEARLFKSGSGSGSNFSLLREKGALLKKGGESSGVMSFLKVGDRAAAAIKSGGANRRAAKMVILDMDHPEIEEFIFWKMKEELKVQMLLQGQEEVLKKNSLYKEDFKKMDQSWQGEAYATVSGQNSNNSVRVSHKFFKKLKRNGDWSLISRTTGKKVKNMKAQDLWDKLVRSAWGSADPGLQFQDTINEWHTCPSGGEIKSSNPCAEYLFLDNTACNLASLNLIKFLDFHSPDQNHGPLFKIDEFILSVDYWINILDISVSMAQFPSSEIAWGSSQYRTLGLGICNLGGFLMSKGIAYDCELGRSYGALCASLLTAASYRSSALLAKKLGPYPQYQKNKKSHLKVLKNHYRSMGKKGKSLYGKFEGLTSLPFEANWDLLPPSLVRRNHLLWQEAIQLAELYGLRNAQVTAIAPTGTIGLLMDCDTTGIEPEFSLIKYKNFKNGETVKMVNQSVALGLKTLGYQENEIDKIKIYIEKNNTVVGAPFLRPSQYPVFDGAMAPSAFPYRLVSAMGHLKMVAAMQPFISGGISKTINLASDCLPATVSEIYHKAHEMMIKCISVYRQGCKLSQPMNRDEVKEAQKCEECSI